MHLCASSVHRNCEHVTSRPYLSRFLNQSDRRKPPCTPEAQFSLQFMQPPALDLSLETVLSKPPAVNPMLFIKMYLKTKTRQDHDMAHVSPSHDMAQVMADILTLAVPYL